MTQLHSRMKEQWKYSRKLGWNGKFNLSLLARDLPVSCSVIETHPTQWQSWTNPETPTRLTCQALWCSIDCSRRRPMTGTPRLSDTFGEGEEVKDYRTLRWGGGDESTWLPPSKAPVKLGCYPTSQRPLNLHGTSCHHQISVHVDHLLWSNTPADIDREISHRHRGVCSGLWTWKRDQHMVPHQMEKLNLSNQHMVPHQMERRSPAHHWRPPDRLDI